MNFQPAGFQITVYPAPNDFTPGWYVAVCQVCGDKRGTCLSTTRLKELMFAHRNTCKPLEIPLPQCGHADCYDCQNLGD